MNPIIIGVIIFFVVCIIVTIVLLVIYLPVESSPTKIQNNNIKKLELEAEPVKKVSTSDQINNTTDQINNTTRINPINEKIGKPVHMCSPDKEREGNMCYIKCNNVDTTKQDLQENPKLTFKSFGSHCQSKCPEGMIDNNESCKKGQAYSRIGNLPDDNGSCKSDEEKSGALCYSKCKDNYHAEGCCTCVPNQNCPAGFTDSNSKDACIKKIYSRGIAFPLECDSEEYLSQNNGSMMCYSK